MATVAAIFAHPDDEAFGPGGTIAKLAQDSQVHLICVTCGERGTNGLSEELVNLSEIRQQELQQSAKILGVEKVHFLNFADGGLNNDTYPRLVEALNHQLDLIRPQRLLTFEWRGVSGHLDHIAVSLAVTYLADHRQDIEEVWFYALSAAERALLVEDYFVFFPPGYDQKRVDHVEKVASVWSRKIAAIQAHRSQKADMEKVLSLLKKVPREEYFFIRRVNHSAW